MKAAESLIKSDRNAGCNSAVWYKEPRGKSLSESVFDWTNHPSIIAYHKPTSTNQINSRTALGDLDVESNSHGSRLRTTIAADLISRGAAIVVLKDRLKVIEGWCGDHPSSCSHHLRGRKQALRHIRRTRWAKCTLTSVSGSHFTQRQAETCRSTKKLKARVWNRLACGAQLSLHRIISRPRSRLDWKEQEGWNIKRRLKDWGGTQEN